uniref:Uncharacterized protein n=1 Tax=Timema shepardi TaxID=629360 RepID=A0A7R9G1Z9_TIMSH|nr:unnamed protein product [Timema shepardi]
MKKERLLVQLEGVTLDSSSDDVSSADSPVLAGYYRRDLSMDSGIQGSSCDLEDQHALEDDGVTRGYVVDLPVVVVVKQPLVSQDVINTLYSSPLSPVLLETSSLTINSIHPHLCVAPHFKLIYRDLTNESRSCSSFFLGSLSEYDPWVEGSEVTSKSQAGLEPSATGDVGKKTTPVNACETYNLVEEVYVVEKLQDEDDTPPRGGDVAVFLTEPVYAVPDRKGRDLEVLQRTLLDPGVDLRPFDPTTHETYDEFAFIHGLKSCLEAGDCGGDELEGREGERYTSPMGQGLFCNPWLDLMKAKDMYLSHDSLEEAQDLQSVSDHYYSSTTSRETVVDASKQQVHTIAPVQFHTAQVHPATPSPGKMDVSERTPEPIVADVVTQGMVQEDGELLLRTPPPQHQLVVVAIDIGTTYSGYAFSFTRDPEQRIHMMRKWEALMSYSGGDPGLNNQKTPTTLLLTPERQFHSFGCAARDYFNDLDSCEARHWYFLDKFKMTLHHRQDVNRMTGVRAANGEVLPVLTVFAHALRHLKNQVLRELSDQAGSRVDPREVRWVVTVPAMWRQPSKQLVREAAYQVRLTNWLDPTLAYIHGYFSWLVLSNVSVESYFNDSIGGEGGVCGYFLTTVDEAVCLYIALLAHALCLSLVALRLDSAGLCDPSSPESLLIALEPEVASICCRKLRLNQLIPERPPEQDWRVIRTSSSTFGLPFDEPVGNEMVLEHICEGTRYMVVDCGGGTVDITVHELSEHLGTLRELHKATGGPCGSVAPQIPLSTPWVSVHDVTSPQGSKLGSLSLSGVDHEFETLLQKMFGEDFILQFRLRHPAAYVELILSFEARKRSASPHRNSSYNIFPPFAFIDYFRKSQNKEVGEAVREFGRDDVTWSSQGMLRLQPCLMLSLFRPTVDKILKHISDVLDSPRVEGIQYLFLVGGFAESQVLQHEVRKAFNERAKVIIPQGVSLTILRGAVQFGLDPSVVQVRRSKQTYGVGVLKRFVHGVHPTEKMVTKDDVEWCCDVLDQFVTVNQPIRIGENVTRRYTPALSSQTSIVINIYCADSDEVEFTTDPGVRQCGTLKLDLPYQLSDGASVRREIQTRMVFGGTEVKASALDISSGLCVNVELDFLAEH